MIYQDREVNDNLEESSNNLSNLVEKNHAEEKRTLTIVDAGSSHTTFVNYQWSSEKTKNGYPVDLKQVRQVFIFLKLYFSTGQRKFKQFWFRIQFVSLA